jgi:hypothetical protein
VIHVYAIARELESLPSLEGLGGSGLERTRIEGFDVVTSRTRRTAVKPTDEAVVRHARVVEALFARSEAVLPARFGDLFPDEQQLVTAVRSKRADLERALTRVQGCVEFGLRVLLPEEDASGRTPVRSGREYLERQLEQATKRWALADQIDEPLARLARTSTRQDHAPAGILLTAAYLVPERAAGAFRREVERLQSGHPDLSIACSGPWPPYSFAEDVEVDG